MKMAEPSQDDLELVTHLGHLPETEIRRSVASRHLPHPEVRDSKLPGGRVELLNGLHAFTGRVAGLLQAGPQEFGEGSDRTHVRRGLKAEATENLSP